jgi:hypothetical protein
VLAAHGVVEAVDAVTHRGETTDGGTEQVELLAAALVLARVDAAEPS